MGRKHKNEDPNYFHGYCAISGYLIHSYLYYEHNRPIIPDTEYDQLCKHIHKRYGEIIHPHKKYVKIDALKCGTGYNIVWENVPQRIIHAAHYLFEKETGFNLPYMVQGRDMVKIKEKRYGKKTPKARKKDNGIRTDVPGRGSKKEVQTKRKPTRGDMPKKQKGQGLLF